MKPNAREAAKIIAAKKRQQEIDQVRIEEERKAFRKKEHAKWAREISKIIDPFKQDFKITFKKEPATWFILPKNVPDNAAEQFYLSKIKLYWAKSGGYNDPDGNGWMNEYENWAVSISKQNIKSRDGRVSSDLQIYRTLVFDDLENKFSEKLANQMADHYQ
jgi:hypothetical protein